MKQWIEPRKLLNGLLVEFRGNMRKCPKLLMQLHPPLHAAGHILKSGLFYTALENDILDLEV